MAKPPVLFGGTPSKKKDEGGGSVLGFVENILGDVKDAATGLPTGLAMLGKDVINGRTDSFEAIGKGMWQTWSPLFRGDFEEFAKQTYDHPLAPLLDLSAFITGGGAVAGRLASVGAAAGVVSKTGRVARLGKAGSIDFSDGVTTISKATSKNPVIRARQEAAYRLANRLGQYVPAVRYEARTERVINRDVGERRAAMTTWIANVVDAGRKLNGPDKLKYEEEILGNSYKQMRKFAIEWDPYERSAGKIVGMKALPKGYRVVREDFGNPEMFKRRQSQEFSKELENFGGRFTFSPNKKGAFNVNRAAKVTKPNGQQRVLLVPAHELQKFGLEAARSHKAIKYLYHKPTTVWKSIILGYRPAFLVNNFVGNHFMYLMANGGAGAVRGYVDAIRQTKGERAAISSLGKAEALLTRGAGRDTSWQDEFFQGQLANTLADTTIGRLAGRVEKRNSLKSRAQEGLFGVTQAVADRFVRRAQINVIMRRNPKVKELMRSRDLSFDQAAREVLLKDANNGGNLRRTVSQEVMDVAGDYHTLSRTERMVRNIVPFYTWDRHIVRHMAKMTRDRPALTAFAAETGLLGEKETERLLGEIPAFVKGSIPLSIIGLGKDDPVRKAILGTSGLNPYASISVVANATKALAFGGKGEDTDTLAGQLNPFIGSLIERVMGRDMLTGQPTDASVLGAVPGVYWDAIKNLPQYKLADKISERETGYSFPGTDNPDDPAKDPLYKKDLQQYLLQFAGLPIKEMSPSAARKRARAQDGKPNKVKSDPSVLF